MISGFSATFANFYLKRSIASIAAAICEGAKSCAERRNVSLILIFHIGTLASMSAALESAADKTHSASG
jgi:hypothetical protein